MPAPSPVPASDQPKPPLWQRASHYLEKEIWRPQALSDLGPRGWFSAVLRVVYITFTGLHATRATIRAAALSFSTIISLGPLVALIVLIAGFALDKKDPQQLSNQIQALIHKIAPQVGQYEQLNKTPGSDPAATPTATKLTEFINGFITEANSGAAGTFSAISLIVIVLLLFFSIENAFNDIWGVRRGRGLLLRIVLYWTILTLGAVLFFVAVGGLSAATLMNTFRDNLPFSSELETFFRFLLPVLSLALIIGVTTLFYRFIPNTHVYWYAALTGAVVFAVLLVLNNLFAFYYLGRVALTSRLYGPAALIAILMLGLYIFWFFVLVGGQISYAVQNIHYRNSQIAWNRLTESTRNRLALSVLLTIARRFACCHQAPNLSELTDRIKVPTQILNEALNALIDLKLISPIPPAAGQASSDYRYQPARPLSKITLGYFKTTFENLGEDPSGETLQQIDPLLLPYQTAIEGLAQEKLFTQSLDELFATHPTRAES